MTQHTIRLRLPDSCVEVPCPTCHAVETAFRRACGLRGVPVPSPREGIGHTGEAYIAATHTIEVAHTCGPEADDGPRLLVDDEPVPLDDTADKEALQEALLRAIDTVLDSDPRLADTA